MKNKLFFLIFFSSVNIYAATPSAHPDQTTRHVAALVDKNIIVDNEGNLQTVTPAHSTETRGSDAISGTERVYSDFNQSMKLMEQLAEQMDLAEKK